MSRQFQLDYIDVAERIVEFRTKRPEGSLQQVSLDFREVNGGWWVIYTAAAYRHPDDPRPGIGTAWEPVPGKTNFTRDSEVQNAETAAWGRAIVAALAADTKRGIASAEETRSASAPRQADDPSAAAQALADLALQVKDLYRLKSQVYDAGKARGLLNAPVKDPVTGEVTQLTHVITAAKANLDQAGAAQ